MALREIHGNGVWKSLTWPAPFCGKTCGKETGFTRMYQPHGSGLLSADK